MTSKTAQLLDKGRESLAQAHTLLTLGKENEAARAAEAAIFLASQAYILKMTDKTVETKNQDVDCEQIIGLARAYSQGEAPDSKGDADPSLSSKNSAAAMESAVRFLAYIEGLME